MNASLLHACASFIPIGMSFVLDKPGTVFGSILNDDSPNTSCLYKKIPEFNGCKILNISINFKK
mgnify:CR=1 FL=1